MCGKRKHIGMWLFMCSLLSAQLLYCHGQKHSEDHSGDFQEEIYSEENENGRDPYDSYSSGDDYLITESQIPSRTNGPEEHYTDEVTFSGYYPDTQLITEQSGPYPSPTESFFAARDVTTITTRVPYYGHTTPRENEDSLPAPELSYQDGTLFAQNVFKTKGTVPQFTGYYSPQDIAFL